MRNSEYILFENREAKYFNDAYPIGNGHLGGMVYGDLPRMRLGLNHDEFWSGGNSDSYSVWDKNDFFEARELALKGEYAKAGKLLSEKYAKLDSSSYLTLGNLLIDFPKGEISKYRRSLDLHRSLANVKFSLNGTDVNLDFFASHPASAIVVKLCAKSPISIEVSVDSPLASNCFAEDSTLEFSGEAPIECKKQIERKSFPPNLTGQKGMNFCGIVGALSDGSVHNNGNRLAINDAKDIMIVFSAATSYKKGDAHGNSLYRDSSREAVSNALRTEYSVLLDEHIADVTKFFDRMSLTLGNKDYSEIPTSKRIDCFEGENGEIDADLITLAFNYGRYLTIAGSREGSAALNLQGIWNDKVSPPWNSNYTTNINTEMNYWPTLACGLTELTEPLDNLIRLIAKNGEKCAAELFGSKGFAANHNSDIFGFCTPASGECLWSFFPFAGAWLMRHIFEKYEYTLDKDYLEEFYPLFLSAATFALDTLIDDGDYFIFSPGTSPENKYILNGEDCHVARSSTMYGAIIREILSEIVEIEKILGKNSDVGIRAAKVMPRLLPIRITNDGRIEEWYFGGETPEFVEPDIHHRHISHLYDLYPQRNITKDAPELFDAAKKSLDVRGDDSTGWSLGWKLCCRARLGDGDAVMRLFRLFFRRIDSSVDFYQLGGGVYANLLCAHPPFQIDGNFAFTAAVCEMLVGEENGEPIPLPALPQNIAEGSIRGLRIKGNRAVDLTFANGKVLDFKVYNC